ncbi:hypothetical protein [Streptomyces clavifer]|uniref:hypothetical protein n=1 Tax=Streptomyces clavifer TaxID=68188 RepID=UPI00343C376B
MDKPAPPASSTPTLSSAEAEAIRLCAEAIVDRPEDDTMRPECEAIPEEHFGDAYRDALSRAGANY